MESWALLRLMCIVCIPIEIIGLIFQILSYLPMERGITFFFGDIRGGSTGAYGISETTLNNYRYVSLVFLVMTHLLSIAAIIMLSLCLAKYVKNMPHFCLKYSLIIINLKVFTLLIAYNLYIAMTSAFTWTGVMVIMAFVMALIELCLLNVVTYVHTLDTIQGVHKKRVTIIERVSSKVDSSGVPVSIMKRKSEEAKYDTTARQSQTNKRASSRGKSTERTVMSSPHSVTDQPFDQSGSAKVAKKGTLNQKVVKTAPITRQTVAASPSEQPVSGIKLEQQAEQPIASTMTKDPPNIQRPPRNTVQVLSNEQSPNKTVAQVTPKEQPAATPAPAKPLEAPSEVQQTEDPPRRRTTKQRVKRKTLTPESAVRHSMRRISFKQPEIINESDEEPSND